jgi:hypothetical protein
VLNPRLLLLGVAGAASLAYLAFGPRRPSTLTRELELATLRHHVENWLPKLPFLQFVRIRAAGSRGFLQISGDGTKVELSIPDVTTPERRLGPQFRQTCARLGLKVRESPGSDNASSLACDLTPEPGAVFQVLDAVLRDVFDVGSESKLIATVPR